MSLSKLRIPFSKYLIVLAALIFGCIHCVHAQDKPGKPVRIMFLLDGSSSMLNEWAPGTDRFHAASSIIVSIIDSIYEINPDAEFAVRVFGHQHPAQEKNCYDTRLEVDFSKQNIAQIATRLNYIHPKGYSPIAWSLKETAENDFTNSGEYAYSIILLTDGGESCGGDICATVQKLLADKISFRPYILSMIDYDPLKSQYDCLGTYLTVAKQTDIAPAISKIIDDNRPVITMTAPPEKPAQPIITPPDTPKTPPKADTNIAVNADKLNNKQQSKLPVRIVFSKFQTVHVPRLPVFKIAYEPEAVLPKTTHADYLKTSSKFIKSNILYALADAPKVRVPHLPKFNNLIIDEPPPVVVKQETPPKNNKPKSTAPPVQPQTPPTVSTTDAAETSVSVYFTNGKGKYYTTEPDMIIADAKTGKTIKHQPRTVDYNGIPEAIEIPAGRYNITFPGSSNGASNVTISADKNNKVEIVVSNGTLAFQYDTNPNRPITEYTALVSRRFEDRSVTTQPCDTILPFQPSNYHIEINTLPPTLYNVDINFGMVTMISLPEPGEVQVQNTERVGRIEFWHPLGDHYVRFYEMIISGDPGSQQARFKPGPYELRYIKPADAQTQKITVVKFRVSSNATTQIKLDL